MQDKRYIIIGGNGFIGKALRGFIKNDEVVTLGRSVVPLHPETDHYYSVQQYPLDEIAALVGENKKNIIIDLSYVSISNTNPVDPGRDFSDNVNLVIGNLNFAKKVGAERYVYISSGGTVYGKTTDQKLNEDHATDPVSHYGVIKLASEKYVQLFCDRNDMTPVILRPSNVYGPGQIPFRGQGIISTVMASAKEKRTVPVYGKGENIRDYIYIDDFCTWLLTLCEKKDAAGIYNAGSGNGYSVMEIIRMIEDLLGRSGVTLTLQHLPGRASDVNRNVLDNGKIRTATKQDCAVDIQEGIEKTWHWIQDYISLQHI